MSSPQPRLHTDRGRAEAFGSVAAAYDQFRPGYPDAMMDEIATLGGNRAVDVGCGTGKAARMLARRGWDVTGVEIDPMMAEVSRGHGIAVEVSSFEGWDDGGRQFDLLTSGQAWHWVDPERGPSKAAQVLRPGGHAALFWNHDRADEAGDGAIAAVYAELAPELKAAAPPSDPRRDRPELDQFAGSADFEAVEVRRFPWQRRFSADEFAGVSMTYSNHVLLPAARRHALAEGLWRAVDGLGGLTVEYETYVIVARRAG